MGDVHYCSGPPVSEMTYTVSSGTLNSSIPYLYLLTCILCCQELAVWCWRPLSNGQLAKYCITRSVCLL